MDYKKLLNKPTPYNIGEYGGVTKKEYKKSPYDVGNFGGNSKKKILKISYSL